MALTKEEVEAFEKQLCDWRDELEGSQSKSMHAMHEAEQRAYPDPTDQASIEIERNFELRIKDRERRLIRKIEKTILRLREGEFGLCEACGGDISIERLKARPVTTLCIECKHEQEQEERTRVS
ncbi:MAG: RNA polymerase-binding protein DksA [Mariprofundaceae bacterium]|nr:RNA polymerase-binding protein DksA [Mariprofundaceae bacterium]